MASLVLPPLRLLAATLAAVTALGCSSYKQALRQYRAGDAQGALDTLAVYSEPSKDQDVTTLRGLASQRVAYADAERLLAEQRYPEARDAFTRARMGQALPSEQSELANQGYCLASLHVPVAQDWDLVGLCSPYVRAGNDQPRMRAIRASYTPFIEAGLKKALAKHEDSASAWPWLEEYLKLPDAKPNLAKHAEQTLVERDNARRAQAEGERQKAEAARAVRAAETRARLAERYGGVRGASREGLVAFLGSVGTIAGTDLFTDVSIKNNVLALGVPGPEYIFPNVRLFAKYNDIFAVWCDCDAHTNVYWDMRVTGGQTAILATFSVNPDSGMSQMDH
jgi:hypothetical protein